MANRENTDAGVRITIDIADAEIVALTPGFSVVWTIGCQYNNFNMPDNYHRAMPALVMGNQMAACGRYALEFSPHSCH